MSYRRNGFSGVRPLVDPSPLEDRGGGGPEIGAAHRVYEHLISLWAPGVIEAAHDLGVFVELAGEPRSGAELARALDADPRAMSVLLDALCAYDLLVEDGNARYALPAELRECLLPDGLFSLVGKIEYDRTLAWRAWRNLADTVRAGTRVEDGSDAPNQIGETEYRSLVHGINFWAPPIVNVLAGALAERGWTPRRPVSLVDVGCGSGIYSHLLLRRFPALTATGIDVRRIMPLALAQADRLGVADRFRPAVMDFWSEDWGLGYDLALFVNIFHLQTPASAEELLRRAAKSLAGGGLVAVVDQIVTGDAHSAQNRFSRLFAASMLATGGGGAYRTEDYDRWLDGAGLTRVALLDTPMHRVLLAGPR